MSRRPLYWNSESLVGNAIAPSCVWASEKTLPMIDVPWNRLNVSLPEYLFWVKA